MDKITMAAFGFVIIVGGSWALASINNHLVNIESLLTIIAKDTDKMEQRTRALDLIPKVGVDEQPN
jgi:hypothetical protein